MKAKILLCMMFAVTCVAGSLAAEPAGLLLRADFHGNGALAAAAGGQKEAAIAEGAAFVAGRDGKPGGALLSAKDGPAARIPMEKNVLPDKGTIVFWFQPQTRFHAGPKPFKAPAAVCDGEGAPSIVFGSTPSLAQALIEACGLDPSFDLSYLADHKWYQFALTWDAANKRVAHWLTGVLTYDVKGDEFKPFAPPKEMAVGSANLAISDLRIYDRPLSEAEIRELGAYRPEEAPAGEGMTYPEGKVDVAALRGKLLVEDNFDTSDSLKNWTLETEPGKARAEIKDGKLRLTSEGGHIVYWYNKADLPADFIAEWDFERTQADGLTIAFFCAKGRKGEDIFDPSLEPRLGIFKKYNQGQINAYHLSYFRGTPNSNLRKNFGHHIVAIGRETITPSPVDKVHKVTIIKQGGRIRFLTDGELCLDWTDDGKTYGPILGAGKFGLRQMLHTGASVYDNFKVFAVK